MLEKSQGVGVGGTGREGRRDGRPMTVLGLCRLKTEFLQIS